MTQNLFQKQKGFTMVELLVVIFIITVIAVTALISLRGTLDSARHSKKMSALRQAESAAEVYKSRYGSYYNFCEGSDIIRIKKDIKEAQEDGGEEFSFSCKVFEDDPHNYCIVVELSEGGSLCTSSKKKLKEYSYVGCPEESVSCDIIN
ncbi:MAG: type II secretion system protein [Patescibacteria group bacterium]|nr:type II secretion system protein [Patescibacteria group bacterium]